MMNSKIIASTCILSLAFLLGACGPIDETYEEVEFTEVTTSEITTSTTTALTSSLTAVSTTGSTVTTLVSTTAVTTVTDGSTAITTNVAETKADKHEDNMQDNVHDVVAVQPPEPVNIEVEDKKYNESNSETPTTQAVTATAAETAVVTTAETTQAVTETEAVVTEEYVVYKPSTKYAHRSTCRWNSGDAYRCDDFSDLEVRLCTECNPEIGAHLEYQTPTVDSGDKTYLGNFYMTYYPETAYYPGVCGGSGRTLRGYGDYSDGIRGSVACRTIQESYGYNRNGRTTVYLEFPSYPCMNGNYWVDDCCGAYGTIDVFVWSEWACPFGYDGVTWADCWIY